MAYMMDKAWIPQLTICRAGNELDKSVIRVAFNALDSKSGRQFIKTGIFIVNSDKEGDYKFIPGPTIRPADTLSSAVYPTFIEADIDAKGNASNINALYWIESTASDSVTFANKNKGSTKKRFSARYYIFSGEKTILSRGYLSVKNGQKREWYSNSVNQGDYFTGGFFHAEGRMNFLAQWTEPDGIKGNLISVKTGR